MAKYTQENRALSVTTPLGPDILLLERVTGTENISEPFQFQLIMLAYIDDLDSVKFENILGKEITVKVKPAGITTRYFHGVVHRFTQVQRVNGPEGPKTFVRYRADIVPKLYFLSKSVKSRIFQQKTVEEILKVVLTGIDVSWKIEGTFQPRDYCVQYRETDLDFAHRLMEEEGIFYYFKHTESGHQMVIGNTPQAHTDVQTDPILFEEIAGADRPDERVQTWVKYQEIRSGKVSLTDYTFETPDKDNLKEKTVRDSVAVGTVTHKIKVASNDLMIVADTPGEYAKRFDGVDKSGGDAAAEISKIADDGDRTVGIRLDEETTRGIRIDATSDCRLMSPGFKFKLEKHFNGDGSYIVTRVEHDASIAGTYLTTSDEDQYSYSNRLQCIPLELKYTPPRKTPKARIDGTQTAIVVGPSGQEIFTDKYSRVKVQFNWDRLGTKDINSSCWVRVGTPWAGKQWGMIHIPRIGQEVIVAFEEGDPDQPIIVGSVYNANNMPPYTLPDNQTQSGLKTRSTAQGTAEMFNELRFEDKKDSEDIYFHAQKDFHRVVENDDDLKVTMNQTILIEKGKRTETLSEGDEEVTLTKGKRTHKIQSDDTLDVVEGARKITVQKDHTLTVNQGNMEISVAQGTYTLDVKTGAISIKAGASSITEEAMQAIELKVGGNSIVINQQGITIKGIMVKVEGSATADVKSPMTTVSGDGMLTLKGGLIMVG